MMVEKWTCSRWITASAAVLNEASPAARRSAEILQMAMLQPKIAIMDENDSAWTTTRCRSCPRASPSWLARPGRAGHHALPAYSEPHQAAVRPHHDGRCHCRERRPRAGASPRRARLRLAARKGCQRRRRSFPLSGRAPTIAVKERGTLWRVMLNSSRASASGTTNSTASATLINTCSRLARAWTVTSSRRSAK